MPVQNSNVVLNKFRVSKIKKDRIVFFIGKRGSGKTTGVKAVLHEHRDIDMGIIICGTEESAQQFREIYPDSFVYGGYDQKILEKCIQIQKLRLFEYNQGKRKKCPYMLIMCDDIMFANPWKGEFARNLFMNGRHWKILLVNTMQYVKDIGPAMRGQIDYAFLYRCNNQDLGKVYEIFGGSFDSKKQFEQVYMKCTENYGCMVIDMTQASGKLQDSVFWYKPPMRDKLKIGSRAMWRFHSRHYDPKKALMGPTMESILGLTAAGPPQPKRPGEIQIIKRGPAQDEDESDGNPLV